MAEDPEGGFKKRALEAAKGAGAALGPEGAIGAAALSAGMAIKARKDAAKERRKEAKQQQKLHFKEFNAEIQARMPKPMGIPIFGWLASIFAGVIWSIRWSFNLVWSPIKWMLETVISPIVQIPFRLFGTALGGILAVIVIFGFIFAGGYLFVTTYPPVMVWFMEHGIHDVADLVVWTVSLPSNMMSNLNAQFEYRMCIATGGCIEADAEGEEVGIKILEVNPAQTVFYKDDPILVWASLEGEGNMDEIEGSLIPSCELIEFAEEGIVTPAEIPLYRLSNTKDGFECEFEPFDVIDEPTKEVQMRIEFPFETEGRVTLVFMDEETIRQMRREDKDPNDVYDIPETPEPVFKAGPVMPSLSVVRSNPIGVARNEGILTQLGFTLKNEWDGEIVEITNVELTLDGGLCLPPAENEKFGVQGPGCSGSSRKTYTVSADYLERLTHGGDEPIERFIFLPFRLEITEDVLDNTVISPKEISVKVSYIYRDWEETRINLNYEPFWDDDDMRFETCGGRKCPDSQVCCEIINTGDRSCKYACTNRETEIALDYGEGDADTGDGQGVDCGSTTCDSSEVCCRCIEPNRPVCQATPYLCNSECDGLTYMEI